MASDPVPWLAAAVRTLLRRVAQLERELLRTREVASTSDILSVVHAVAENTKLAFERADEVVESLRADLRQQRERCTRLEGSLSAVEEVKEKSFSSSSSSSLAAAAVTAAVTAAATAPPVLALAPAPAKDSPFQEIGTRVRIVKLKARSDLNGSVGVATGFDKAKSRCAVQLDHGEKGLFKETNVAYEEGPNDERDAELSEEEIFQQNMAVLEEAGLDISYLKFSHRSSRDL